MELLGKQKKNSNLRIFGVFLIGIAVILTAVYFADELKLEQLAWVTTGPDGVTVGGLSEENAMWFGGAMVIFYVLGPILIAKGR